LLSNFAFNFNLRHYIEVEGFAFSGGGAAAAAVYLCLLPQGEPLSWCEEWPG